MRPVLVRELGRDFTQRDYAVRVANRRGAEREVAVENTDLLIDDLARRTSHRYSHALKADCSHVDGDESSAILDHRADVAARSLNCERGVLYQPTIPEKSRKDSQPVT